MNTICPCADKIIEQCNNALHNAPIDLTIGYGLVGMMILIGKYLYDTNNRHGKTILSIAILSCLLIMIKMLIFK